MSLLTVMLVQTRSLFAALSSAWHFKLSSCGLSELVAVAWKCFGKYVFISFVCILHLLVLNGFLEGDCHAVTAWVASLFLSSCLLNTISFCVLPLLPACLAFRPSVTLESASRKFLSLRWKTKPSQGELNWLLTVCWKVGDTTTLNYDFIFHAAASLHCLYSGWRGSSYTRMQ